MVLGVNAITLAEQLRTPEDQVARLQQLRVLPVSHTCPTCNITTDSVKRREGTKYFYFWCSGCKSSTSIRKGTMLSSKGITFRTFLMIGYFFVAMNMTHQQLIHEVNLVCPEGEEGEYTLGTTLTSCHTTVFYNKVFRCDKIIYDLNLEIGLCAMCRDIIAEEMFESSQDYMIGGPGTTVEVDESMFGRCCYYTSQHNALHTTTVHNTAVHCRQAQV